MSLTDDERLAEVELQIASQPRLQRQFDSVLANAAGLLAPAFTRDRLHTACAMLEFSQQVELPPAGTVAAPHRRGGIALPDDSTSAPILALGQDALQLVFSELRCTLSLLRANSTYREWCSLLRRRLDDDSPNAMAAPIWANAWLVVPIYDPSGRVSLSAEAPRTITLQCCNG